MISKNRYLALQLCLALSLLTLGQATLAVYNMQALGEDVPQLLNISYSIANFGFAPYGKTIVARVMHAPGFSDECTLDQSDETNYQNAFLLIPRGKCEFVTKALNVQRLGAQMAIIMDNQKHEQLVVMVDNGYGYKVNIPTIFINYDQGQQLKTLIDDNKESSVMMKIAFENTKTAKVDVSFWLQANNRHSYRLVQDFRKYYHKIEENVNFQVVFASSTCSYCEERDCYFDKQYCAINLIHNNTETDTGKLILDQQIREQIVLQLYPHEWWKYMKYVDLECGIISELKECGEAGMVKHDIDPSRINDAFKKSFSDKDNTYLANNKKLLENSGVSRYPTVMLNKVKVKASLNAQFIFDDICNTLIDPPPSCQKYVSSTDYQKIESHEWWTLIIVVTIGLILFSVIFCLYRRYMKKKISYEMQSRVDDMVSKYIEFYSERNGKK